jgi:hypothetical protein
MPVDSVWKAEARAAEVLKQLGINTLPVSPFLIADAKDIVYQENPSLRAGVSGCLMKVEDVFGIMYSSRFASEGFKRFTVSHELGHYFLDGHVAHLFRNGQIEHQSTSGFLSDDPYEREADAFAAGLLMPKSLFKPASDRCGRGLAAIETLADVCQTSLTATAIRYANLSNDPVAIICSEGQKIAFAVMSKPLKDCRGLTWIRKGTGLPQNSATAAFNRDSECIRRGQRTSGDATFGDWFERDETELREEVVGLGEYGRTLTILTADDVPEEPRREVEEKYPSEDDEESLLPSERFYRRTRY